jgi:hypothetical protein
MHTRQTQPLKSSMFWVVKSREIGDVPPTTFCRQRIEGITKVPARVGAVCSRCRRNLLKGPEALDAGGRSLTQESQQS